MFIISFGLAFAPIVLLALLIAIVMHEIAHAWVAAWSGDLTAKFSKRTSLNPVRHFNWLGFLMLILVGFGFAKPVPVNVENFRNKRKGTILVSLAGVITNLLLALTSAFFLVIIERFGAFSGYGIHLYPARIFNVSALSTIPQIATAVFAVFFGVMVQINVVLALFNLLPLFPLDGHRLMEAGLGSFNKVVKFTRDWGMAVLLGLVGFDFVIGMLSVYLPNIMPFGLQLSLFSPLRLYMHFVGGGIAHSFMNLFRIMFGVTPIWPF